MLITGKNPVTCTEALLFKNLKSKEEPADKMITPFYMYKETLLQSGQGISWYNSSKFPFETS